MNEEINTPTKVQEPESDFSQETLEGFQAVNTPRVDEDPFVHNSADLARSKFIANTPPAPQPEKNNHTGTKVATAIALSAAAVVVGEQMIDAVNGPTYSDETTSFTVGADYGNNSVTSAAEHIKNIDPADIGNAVTFIQNMPENKDTLADGLQPGEVLIIPDHVESK